VTSFSVIDNKLREQLRTIINEPIQDNEIEPFKNVKRLYQACVNTDAIEALGVMPVKNIIDSMGGWPAVVGDTWNTPDTWTWQQASVWSRENGYSVSNLLSFSVSTDNKNTTKRIIRVSFSRLCNRAST
jgi:predicted metalloendopeptidase